MPQTLAMNARYKPFDAPGIGQAAQLYRARELDMENAPLKNQLERMKINDEMGQQSALAGYRMQAKDAGPIDALPALDGYPEMQGQLYKALDGMDPADRVKSAKRADAFGRAAQWVLSLPNGSPEQKRAWETSLSALLKDGYIDQEVYNAGIQSGPTAEILNQALTVQELIKKYTGPQADLTRARIRDIGADNERADLRTQALNEQGDARVGIQRDKATGKTAKTATAANKARAAAQRRVDALLRSINSQRSQAGDDPIAYGSQEYLELKRQVFAEDGIPMEGAPSAPAAPAERPTQDDAVQQAQDAIARGADPEAVRAELERLGYDATGLETGQ